MMVQRFRLPRRMRATAMTAALLSVAALTAPSVDAQTPYTCFPTCQTNDGRMLSLAGTGYDAFAGNKIDIGIGFPPGADTLEIGIFDGESSGYWDRGTYPLTYKLFADPYGNGDSAVLVATYYGNSMTDNAWYTIRRGIDSEAQADNDNYVYYLEISMATNAVGSTSSFKLRTNGTITVRSHQSFSIQAPMTSGLDAGVIYPYYSSSDLAVKYSNPRYNGIWNIYLDVISPSSELTIWDGDMDHGSDPTWSLVPSPRPADTDDEDTPSSIPSFVASGDTNVVAEGAAGAMPYDDNKADYNRRSPAIRYDVQFPSNGPIYSNNNPSGSREWEQFKISTATMDRSAMDWHADSIPAGVYTVRVEGMDMLNVNAWRFFNNVISTNTSNVEVIGVNETGLPVAPIRATEAVNGMITGTVYYDSDTSQTQDAGEPGLPTVGVKCYMSVNGSWTLVEALTTDSDGNFFFTDLGAGSYKIEIESGTLQSDVVATYDLDGASTANVTAVTIDANNSTVVASFGYRRGVDVGTLTRGYWVNHEENWPVSTLTLGGDSYTKEELLNILRRPTRGDKSYAMAAQLIATKLNLASGTDASCIGSDVVAADDWLDENPMDEGRTSDQVWSTGSTTHDNLDDYNNGRLCEGHMD